MLSLFLQLLWAVFVTGLVWYSLRAAHKITYITLADGRRQERRLPFLLGLLLPLTPSCTRWFSGPRFQAIRQRLQARLTSAGFEDAMAAEEFLALRILCPALCAPVLIMVMVGFFALVHGSLEEPVRSRIIFLALAIVLWMILYPHFWLKQAIARRHQMIVKALPFVIDLLTLSVEAGLDFMTAIKNIINRRALDPLGEELARVLFEIQLGKTRRAALRTMADRLRQPDIQSLVTALAQADELGVSIGTILRVQADQIRGRRFMRAEKLANEAPVKMLFPLVACIFPAVFLILLGPIILQMLHQAF